MFLLWLQNADKYLSSSTDDENFDLEYDYIHYILTKDIKYRQSHKIIAPLSIPQKKGTQLGNGYVKPLLS